MESKPFWLNEGRYQAFRSSETLPQRCDVVVIGGGITGVSTAYWLSRFDVPVLLLEKRGLASGASGRNGGHIIPGTVESYNRTVERDGQTKAVGYLRFQMDTIEEIQHLSLEHNFDCQLRLDGNLSLATSENELAELQASVEMLVKSGFDAQWWDKTEVVERLHTDAFLGAMFRPDGGQLHPARLVWGLAEAALDQGAMIHTGTEVLEVTSNDGLTVKTDQGDVQAEMVVYATNAYTPLLHPFFKDKIDPVRGQVLATKPAGPIFPLGWGANFSYEYCVQDDPGHIILGGWRWSQKDYEMGHYDDTVVVPEIHEGLYDFLTSAWSSLRGIAVQQAWTGIMGFSQDGWPIVGTLPGHPREFVAAGFTGHGMPVCFGCGKAVAELIHHGRCTADIEAFSPRRFL